MTPRIPALTPELMNDAQRAVADRIAGGPRGAVRGPWLALLQDPELTDRVQHLGEFIRYNTGIPNRLTELAILIAARRWDCQYEWFAHAPIARNAGVGQAAIDAIAAGAKPDGLDDEENAIYEFCAGVHKTGEPDDAAFALIVDRFGMKGAVDLVALCGYYSLLAMVLNTARQPLPGGAVPPLAMLPSD